MEAAAAEEEEGRFDRVGSISGREERYSFFHSFMRASVPCPREPRRG